jgi:hypothetical protein
MFEQVRFRCKIPVLACVVLCVVLLKTDAKIGKITQKFTHGFSGKRQKSMFWQLSGRVQKAIRSLSRRRQGFKSPWGRHTYTRTRDGEVSLEVNWLHHRS